MLQIKKELIISFMERKIDLNYLIKNYPKKNDDIDICTDLREAFLLKDSDAVELLLFFGEVVQYDYKCINQLNELIVSEWHKKHEDLARLLDRYKEPSSVDYLYKVSLMNLEYLEYDEDFALAEKCIRAMGKIGTSDAIKYLKLLNSSDNEKIRRIAEKVLSKIS